MSITPEWLFFCQKTSGRKTCKVRFYCLMACTTLRRELQKVEGNANEATRLSNNDLWSWWLSLRVKNGVLYKLTIPVLSINAFILATWVGHIYSIFHSLFSSAFLEACKIIGKLAMDQPVGGFCVGDTLLYTISICIRAQ